MNSILKFSGIAINVRKSASAVSYIEINSLPRWLISMTLMPLPNKDEARIRYKEKQKQQAAMMQNIMKQFPEIGEKILQKQMLGGGGKR